jgi:hypothetical protein
MIESFRQSIRRHGPWHVMALLGLGILVGLIGVYVLLSQKVIYCPMGGTDAVFNPIVEGRIVDSELGGARFRFPANFAAFEHNQTSGRHAWLVWQGVLPGMRPLSGALDGSEKSKLETCDFYIKDKIVVAVLRKKPKPGWSDPGTIDTTPAERILAETDAVPGPHGLTEHRASRLAEGYDDHPFPKVWLYSHAGPAHRREFLYCWRDKIGLRGCYAKAAPLDPGGDGDDGDGGLVFKYFFSRGDLERWPEIARAARALVRGFHRPDTVPDQ